MKYTIIVILNINVNDMRSTDGNLKKQNIFICGIHNIICQNNFAKPGFLLLASITCGQLSSEND